MRRLAVLLLLLTVACGSASTRPPDIARPEIVTYGAGSVFFGAGSSAPVTLQVDVTNRANVPLRVRAIEISSPGMVQYTLRRVSRVFNEEIPPGDTRTMTLFTMAYTQTRNPSEPLNVQTIVTFEYEGKRFREIVQ